MNNLWPLGRQRQRRHLCRLCAMWRSRRPQWRTPFWPPELVNYRGPEPAKPVASLEAVGQNRHGGRQRCSSRSSPLRSVRRRRRLLASAGRSVRRRERWLRHVLARRALPATPRSPPPPKLSGAPASSRWPRWRASSRRRAASSGALRLATCPGRHRRRRGVGVRMTAAYFDRDKIVRLLKELGSRLDKRGVRAEMFVVRGGAMALAYRAARPGRGPRGWS